MDKPQRTIRGRVASLGDEATAYLRRRRARGRPAARVGLSDDRAIAVEAETDAGRALFLAAARLIDAAR